jgi:hypothetical protein
VKSTCWECVALVLMRRCGQAGGAEQALFHWLPVAIGWDDLNLGQRSPLTKAACVSYSTPMYFCHLRNASSVGA